MEGLSSRARLAIFTGILGVALIVLIPMRFGLGWIGLSEGQFSAQQVEGSLWSGRLSHAAIGQARLGTVDAGLKATSLLSGITLFSISRTGDHGNGVTAVFGVSRSALELTNVFAQLPAEQLSGRLPIQSLTLEDLSVRFEDSDCVYADGFVRVEAVFDLAGFALPETFSGTARCEENHLLLPLTSQSGMEVLNLHIERSGGYQFELLVRTEDQIMRENLVEAGFRANQDGFRIAGEGQF